MSAFAKKIVKTFVLTAASVATLIASGNAAKATETFQVNGGIALNTNNNFAKFDTQPVMSSWTHNINDVDQQFDRIQGARGGVLLKHLSTNKCLNARYMWNGANLNVWNCDVNDPDQNWNVISVGNGEFLLRREGSINSSYPNGLCVDSPYRQNGGKIHMIACNSGNANQRWKSTTVGTIPLPPTNSSYRSTVESVLRSFFSNTTNTNGENWSGKTITQMWDRIGGESAQFPTNLFTSGDKWQVDMPAEIYNVYKDLSTGMFGSVKAVNTGYAYDYGYYPGYGAHSALDIGASNGTSLKAAATGVVVDNRAQYYNGSFNGYWIAVDELNAQGQKTGRRWWYGHLATRSVNVGQKVTAGQTILGTIGQGHVHLGVVSNYTTYSTAMYGNEVRNGSTSLGYSAAVNDVLSRTMSPLEAYWRSRNNLNQ